MRKDIYYKMKIMKQDDIKSNYAALAKQLGCDYRTVKKYYLCAILKFVRIYQKIIKA